MQVIEMRDRAQWNAAVLAAPRADLLQSWEWGEFKRQSGGWQPLRLAALSGDEVVAGAQVLSRSALGARFLYTPRGPWWREWQGVPALMRYVRRQGAFRAPLLRADPPLAEAGALSTLGFRPAPRQFQPRATIVVDLTAAPEEILARFNAQVRYNARLAERKGVEVVQVGMSEVEAFWNLYAATAGRKGFEWRALSYFASLVDVFGDAVAVFLARRAGETLAGAIVLIFGVTAYYLYGASGGDRSVKPAELVQYRAMLWARDRGATRYDMWGVPAHPTEDNPLYGVYRFKSGFGGREETYVGALDLPLVPLVPWAPGLAESLALRTRSALHGEGFHIHDHLA
jgi:lipid II:glycine glycyltransferase (peptidoglycan interpeptide bridge formation enzyme)